MIRQLLTIGVLEKVELPSDIELSKEVLKVSLKADTLLKIYVMSMLDFKCVS